MENRDPDGLECYSDHAHTVLTYGACDFCGSTDVNVVGHILPDVERYKGVDPVSAAAIVMHTQSSKMFDGVLLDLFSASAITEVYSKLRQERHREWMRTHGLVEVVEFTFRLISKVQS